jgi:hypothetical protein
MSDWTVYFRTSDGHDAASRKFENERSAFIHARDLSGSIVRSTASRVRTAK